MAGFFFFATVQCFVKTTGVHFRQWTEFYEVQHVIVRQRSQASLIFIYFFLLDCFVLYLTELKILNHWQWSYNELEKELRGLLFLRNNFLRQPHVLVFEEKKGMT